MEASPEISAETLIEDQKNKVTKLKDEIFSSGLERFRVPNLDTYRYTTKEQPPVDAFQTYLDAEIELSKLEIELYRTKHDIGRERQSEAKEMKFTVAKNALSGREDSQEALKNILVELHQYGWRKYEDQAQLLRRLPARDKTFDDKRDELYRLEMACLVPERLLNHYGFPKGTVR